MTELLLPGVYSEGRFFTDSNGILYTNKIKVKFNEYVVESADGQRVVPVDNIKSEFSGIRALMLDLEQRFGHIDLIKQIPSANYGDIIRVNKRTNEDVEIEDISQLYAIKFSQVVPIDSVIAQFLLMSTVEYAHQPISILVYDEPNDPKFQEGLQWNLDVIQAVDA